MSSNEPVAEIDQPYSSDDAQPTPWTDATRALADAGVYWLSTVRPDGSPHVTPIAGVWMDGSFFFSTGGHERKARNLDANRKTVVMTASTNAFHGGLDVVLEGEAANVREDAALERLAEAFAKKYDDFFGFEVRDGAFTNGEGGVADVYEVAPQKAFAYGREPTFSATRYRF
jgi:general stress protein 26